MSRCPPRTAPQGSPSGPPPPRPSQPAAQAYAERLQGRTRDDSWVAPPTRDRSRTDPTPNRQPSYIYEPLLQDSGDRTERRVYDPRDCGWDPEQNDPLDLAIFHNPFGGHVSFPAHTEVQKRMAKFQSIAYWEPNTKAYREELPELERNRRGTKWLVFALIGVCVGLVSFVMMQTIELLSVKRRALLEYVYREHAAQHAWHNWRAYGAWLLSGALMVAVSTGVCGLWRHAAGSGVPDVIAYLNGVALPKVFNIRTLLAKIISCSCAVGGGLPVGPEGPMIHIGALVGAGLGTGRSRMLRCLGRDSCVVRFMGRYRNAKDHRDFITGGAAAGVACAFSAPIGGLLFVVEELTSHTSRRMMWMSFFASLCAVITANSLLSNFEAWQLREQRTSTKCTEWSQWRQQYTVLFYANVLENVNLLSFPFTVVLGIICGMLGSCFIALNLRVVRLRNAWVNGSRWRMHGEPLLVLLVYTLLIFWAASASSCRAKPGPAVGVDPEVWLNAGTDGLGGLEFFDVVCSSKDEYNPIGTLGFASADKVVRLLFRRHYQSPPEVPLAGPAEAGSDAPREDPWLQVQGVQLFNYAALAAWLFIYFFMACWCAGSYLASGIVIPMLTVGATIGRLWGLAVWDIMERVVGERCEGTDAWVDPGVFAMLGAAAFFGGVSRLTFSLCVIMLELTGDLPHLPNVMIAVWVAKVVADRFNHSLYHGLLEVKCVPFLDFPKHLAILDSHFACDIMHRDPVMLQTRETVASLVRHLTGEVCHSSFPVVSRSKSKDIDNIFRGTVSREDLELILWWIQKDLQKAGSSIQSSPGPNVDLERLTYSTMIELKEAMFWDREWGSPWETQERPEPVPACLRGKSVDLTPFVNSGSAFTVPEHLSVAATYTLFRTMGLSHLTVVGRFNNVVGVITRMDLIDSKLVGHRISPPPQSSPECSPRASPDQEALAAGLLPPEPLEPEAQDGSGALGFPRNAFGTQLPESPESPQLAPHQAGCGGAPRRVAASGGSGRRGFWSTPTEAEALWLGRERSESPPGCAGNDAQP
eukprot:TRINITY_DN65304_c0_g1_i1.p1 TRINITY_DN65304_c0_g1~~TRINITY_DN65304_c0_g1_i1.p1  ORF type:complete len:1039 (+),score=235.26 TRINITY_DN65304_c0_g1_i1:86-3202(+)